MVNGPTKDLVVRLRDVRRELELPISEIMQKLEKNGTPLSESTIRRVFNDDLETITGFSYETTLSPLASVLLPQGDTHDSVLSASRIEGLLAVIAIKDEMIEAITQQIQELKAAREREKREAEAKQDARCKKCEDNVAFLKGQIALKDERMDKKDEWINQLLEQQTGLLSKLADKLL